MTDLWDDEWQSFDRYRAGIPFLCSNFTHAAGGSRAAQRQTSGQSGNPAFATTGGVRPVADDDLAVP